MLRLVTLVFGSSAHKIKTQESLKSFIFKIKNLAKFLIFQKGLQNQMTDKVFDLM